MTATPSASPGPAARLSGLWPPLIVGAGFLALWELAVVVFGIDEFLLPKPSSIIGALRSEWSTLTEALVQTGIVAVSGLVIGVAVALALALVVSRFARVRDAATPLAVALNATPIIALAPIFNAWFGITSYRSNQAVVVAVEVHQGAGGRLRPIMAICSSFTAMGTVFLMSPSTLKESVGANSHCPLQTAL